MDGAVLVDEADVAGAEEAVGVEGLVPGQAEVAIHHRGPGDGQLAVLAGTQHLAGVGVDDPQAHPGQQPPGAGLHLLPGVSHRWLATLAQVSDIP